MPVQHAFAIVTNLLLPASYDRWTDGSPRCPSVANGRTSSRGIAQGVRPVFSCDSNTRSSPRFLFVVRASPGNGGQRVTSVMWPSRPTDIGPCPSRITLSMKLKTALFVIAESGFFVARGSAADLWIECLPRPSGIPSADRNWSGPASFRMRVRSRQGRFLAQWFADRWQLITGSVQFV